jgi:perosamine synthetase
MNMAMIPWWRTCFGEEEIQQLTAAVHNEHISQGPLTAEFESRVAEMLHVPYAVATTSGSVALLMALMALGIGRDDEVIIPNRTWIATAHAPLILGAKVKLVDVIQDLPVMDVSQIRKMITPRTKAIIPVHLNGRGVDMNQILALAKKFDLQVVEDACQALFSRNNGVFLGTQSDAGCFSLGVTKFISTGQGGVVVTRSRNTYENLKLIRNHGVVDNFTDRWNQIGCNFKFTDLLAAFGLAQLGKVEARIDHVNEVYTRYVEALKGLSFLRAIPVNTAVGEVPLFMEVLCEERKRLMEYLKERGIQTRPSLPSLHLSSYFEHDGSFPHSELFANQGFFLPCGPDQPMENVETVIRAIQSFQ